MKLKITLAALILGPLLLTGCGKKEAPAETAAAEVATTEAASITPEQQAAIDSIDQPILDDKNTDIPIEVSNAAADVATAEVNGSEAVAH